MPTDEIGKYWYSKMSGGNPPKAGSGNYPEPTGRLDAYPPAVNLMSSPLDTAIATLLSPPDRKGFTGYDRLGGIERDAINKAMQDYATKDPTFADALSKVPRGYFPQFMVEFARFLRTPKISSGR